MGGGGKPLTPPPAHTGPGRCVWIEAGAVSDGAVAPLSKEQADSIGSPRMHATLGTVVMQQGESVLVQTDDGRSVWVRSDVVLYGEQAAQALSAVAKLKGG